MSINTTLICKPESCIANMYFMFIFMAEDMETIVANIVSVKVS
jgi:hypothetical protein